MRRLFLPAATKLGQGNVFTGVCDSVHGGGCLPQCMLEYPLEQTPPGPDPPWTRHTPPQEQPPRTRHHPLRSRPPLGADTPPWEQTPPLGSTPPGADTSPWEADASIRSMSGQCASYWNAFLLKEVSSLMFESSYNGHLNPILIRYPHPDFSSSFQCGGTSLWKTIHLQI